MDRVVWVPTAAEVSALTRAAVLTVLRRDLTIITAILVVLGLATWPLYGPVGLVLVAGVPLAVLGPFFLAVTHRRNARVVRSAYPVGVEASAEATDDRLRLVSAVAAVELPWSRLSRPRVGPAAVAFRDTLTRHPTVIPRQLFPDAWLGRLGVPPDQP